MRVGPVELGVQGFGDRGAPPVLLINGIGASMDWWETDFCRALADGGRFVVRYDRRDTGRSTHYPPGRPGYGTDDLVEDAAGVLGGLGLPAAHVVGIAMGGMVAQLLALAHPERVSSLVLMSTNPGPGDPDLPPVAEKLTFDEPPDFADRDAVLDHQVQAQRRFASPSAPVDEPAARELAAVAAVAPRTPRRRRATTSC